MRLIRSVMTALLLLALLVVPASAQSQAPVTYHFKLTLYGEVPQGETFYVSFSPEGHPEGFNVILCGESPFRGGSGSWSGPGPDCEGDPNGKVYTESLEVPALFEAGTTARFGFTRVKVSGERQNFHSGTATLDPDESIDAWFGYGGAGPDDQQQEMVTKTFKLTVHGDVAEGQAFTASYNLTGVDHAVHLPFCGRGTDVDCEGNGTVYTASDQVQAGRRIDVRFVRVMTDTETAETFLKYTETLSNDKTNTACYDFSDSGRCQQQIPEALPDTGAGGMAGSALPLGHVASALVLLAGSGCVMLRRR